jgi:hypothetical protein
MCLLECCETVHLGHKPLFPSCTNPGWEMMMKMSVEQSVKWLAKETEVLVKKNHSHCHFFNQKSQLSDWGSNPGSNGVKPVPTAWATARPLTIRSVYFKQNLIIDAFWDFVPYGASYNRRFGEHIASILRIPQLWYRGITVNSPLHRRRG